MTSISIEAAQAQLLDIIHRLAPGDELLITEHNQPIAKLARTTAVSAWPCQAGSAKDTAHWMAADFDAPLEEFKEYME